MAGDITEVEPVAGEDRAAAGHGSKVKMGRRDQGAEDERGNV